MLIIDRYGAAAEALTSALSGTDYISRLERSEEQAGRNAVALCSVDAALHTALYLSGVRAGDYVFVPTYTFYSYIGTVRSMGAVPVFLDCDPITRCMSAAALETALTWAELQNKLPKAAIIDNAFGSVADFDTLEPLCKAWGVHTVELCVDAQRIEHKGKRCGDNCDFGIVAYDKRLPGGGAILICSEDGEARRFCRLEYSGGESHDYRMNGYVAALDCARKAAMQKLTARARKNLAAVSNALDCVISPVSGDAALFALTKTFGKASELSAHGFEVKHLPPVHTLPMYRDNAFFEHERGYAVCDTFAQYSLVGMDISTPKRIKLIGLLKNA